MKSSIIEYTEHLEALREDPKSCWFLEKLCFNVNSEDDTDELKKFLEKAETAQYIQISSNDDNHIADIVTYMNGDEFKNAIKDCQCVTMTLYVSNDYDPNMDDLIAITDCLQGILKYGSTILWGCTLLDKKEKTFEVNLLGLE